MSCGCQNKTDHFRPDAPETTEIIPEITASQSLHRRTFMKAAAIGTTVAAIAAREGFSPAPALADDLSAFQCTANDVRIIGTAQILNEPCGCTGTFNAQASFTVENNAASDRGCITLHLIPVTLPDGTVISPGDVILQGTIPGKTTQTMTGSIQNWPCGAGLVCFGAPSADGRRRCEAGECPTVSWTVPGQDTCPPDRQISSKCRHQQICIQGRGNASLICNDNGTDCTVDCGGSATVTLCTSGGPGPFTFALSDGQSFGPSADLCHTFTVGPITEDTSFTGTVTDSGSPPCPDTAGPVNFTTNNITPGVGSAGESDCIGLLTFTASVAGFEGCTFTWEIDDEAAANTETDELIVRVNADGTLTYRNLDGACHEIGVNAVCGTCVGSTTTSVTQCVTTTGC
jgi:hypothetical protein